MTLISFKDALPFKMPLTALLHANGDKASMPTELLTTLDHITELDSASGFLESPLVAMTHA